MITLVYGQIGTGKSSLAVNLAHGRVEEQAFPARPRLLWIDALGELPGARPVHDHEAARAVSWTSPDLDVLWTAPPWWELFAALSDCSIVIDEADMYWPGSVIRDPALRSLLARCRHYGLDLLCITQRPSQTPPLVRSLAGEVYCLSLSILEDRQYVYRSWGLEPPRKPFRWVRWKA